MADAEQELKKLRDRIDALDADLLRLINERATIAQRIGKLKQGAIYRPEREAQVLRRMADVNPGPLTDIAVQRIVREVMSACLALEQPLIIAYLGPAGTYSEAAAAKHFGAAPALIPCSSIDEIFRTVEAGTANYGVVPVENSTEGAIVRTLDLLLSSPLMICGEINLPIHHQLMGHADLQSATQVFSHAQSLAQCHEWLNTHLPAVSRVAVASNAEAARLASQEKNSLAIAGQKAAELYALPVLAANIEDDPGNTTRFVVIAEHDAGPSGNDRTSLICSAKNQPGAVYHLLAPLAEQGVSMSRLESRPARNWGGKRWEYVFYLDIEGHQADPAVARALDALEQRADFIKYLGSYPKAVY
jgi:chorismate mutase/prephenate dehydratase